MKKTRVGYRHKGTGKFVTHPKMAAPVKLAGVSAVLKSMNKLAGANKRRSK